MVARGWWNTALDEAQRHGRRGQLNLSRARSYLSFYSRVRSRGPVCSATRTLVPPWVADAVWISQRKRTSWSRSWIAHWLWSILEGNRPADNSVRTCPSSDRRRSKRMRSRFRSWISERSKKTVEQWSCEKEGTWNEYFGLGKKIVAAVQGKALGAIESRVTHLSLECLSLRTRKQRGFEFAVVKKWGVQTRWVFGVRACVQACVQARASSRGDARRGPEPTSRLLLARRRRRPHLIGAVRRRIRVTRMRECEREREEADRAWLHLEKGSSKEAISAPV